MAVLLRNVLGCEQHLSGFRNLGPGEAIEVTYEEAMRWRHASGLEIDFHGGAKPFKEGGKVKYLNVNTPPHPYTGYGRIGLTAVRGLLKRGVDVHVTNPVPRGLRGVIEAEFPEAAHAIYRPDSFVSEVCLSHTLPMEFNNNPSPRVVGWTMWEGATLPSNFIAECKLAERLVVPSSGMIPIFEPAGLPIDVVRDAPNVEDFPYTDRDQDPEVFTFVSFSNMSSRKCPMETMQCFSAAFPGRKDVRLVMKTTGGMFGGGTLGIPEVRDDRITIINEAWPTARLVEFLHNAHAFLFLSRGEGCGNPSLSAMATGLPTILSNHSGLVDQCSTYYNYPIGLDPHEPLILSPFKGGWSGHVQEDVMWWNPHFDEAVEQMREVYNNREKAFAKGKRAAKWVRKMFSEEQMIDGLLGVLNKM